MTISGSTGRQVEHRLLLNLERLESCADEFPGGALQERFDAAHEHGVGLARERLAHQLTVTLDVAHDERENRASSVGRFVGFPTTMAPTHTIVQQVVESASRAGQGVATLEASELVRPIASGGPQGQSQEPMLDLCRPERLWPLLDRGWQLRVVDPVSIDPAISALLHDIDTIYGVRRSLLVYGVRSALGAPPDTREHDRILIQLDGQRSVSQDVGGDRTQHRMSAGEVLVAHAGTAIGHLPRDLGSLHLEVEFGSEPTGARTPASRARAALVASHITQTHATAHEVIASDPDVGWPMRLLAPGGVQVKTANATSTDVVVAGHRLHLSPDGTELLLALAQSEFIAPSDAALACDCEVQPVVEMFERLWGIGILDAAPPSPPALPASRLTQVAAATIDAPQVCQNLLTAIDPDSWRAATSGEVHHGPAVEVRVQTADLDGPAASLIGQLADVAASMNHQFFGADVTQLDPTDPPLFVRVRPRVSTDTTSMWLQSISSDVSETNGNRKITFVFSLLEPDEESSDGWIRLAGGSPVVATGPGDLSAWVSMRSWALSPLHAGERVFLIGRLHGPPFR